MSVGKNKIERWIRVWVDDSAGTPRDLSVAVIPGTMSGLGGKAFDEVDMTGISEAHKHFLAAQWAHEFACQFFLDDTATTGAHTVLNGIAGGAAVTLTIQFGAGAAPTAGDPEWEGEYILIEAPIVLAGNKPAIAARFVIGSSVAPVWGVYA